DGSSEFSPAHAGLLRAYATDCDHSGRHGVRTNGSGMVGGRMKRREFITLLGSAAAVWPLAAHARQTWRLPAIGFLSPTTASIENQRVAAFVQRLRELGWIEGRTVAVKVRWAEGRSERVAEIVAEFVRQKIDVIVSRGTVNVLAAKQATIGYPNCLCRRRPGR